MGDALVDATDIHHDRLLSFENTCEVLISSIQTLKSRVGSLVDIGEKFTAPTLWGSTVLIAYYLSKVSEDFETIKDEDVKYYSQCLRLQIRAMKIDELACKSIGLSSCELMNLLNK